MTRRRKSVWDRLEEKLIFKPTTSTPRKKKLTPTEIPTYDAVWPLIQSRFNRVRRTRWAI